MLNSVKVLAPLALAGVLVLAGCGDDDGGGAPADAPVAQVDAMVQQIDAMSTAEAVGTICTLNNPTECSAEAPVCTTTAMGATMGFCTAECGTVPDTGDDPPTMAPAGGNATCAAAYMGEGTPGCVLYDGSMIDGMGTVPFTCAILCGTLMGNDLGQCPSHLTCQSNVCLP